MDTTLMGTGYIRIMGHVQGIIRLEVWFQSSRGSCGR